jgi:hypothetical protein
MSATKKEKFISSESIEFEKAVDFYICSESDVFVPSVPGPFYERSSNCSKWNSKSRSFGIWTHVSLCDQEEPYCL